MPKRTLEYRMERLETTFLMFVTSITGELRNVTDVAEFQTAMKVFTQNLEEIQKEL